MHPFAHILTVTLLFNPVALASAAAFDELDAIEQQKLLADDTMSGDQFAVCVDLDGDTAVIGANLTDPFGSTYVFVREGTTWTQQATLNDPFGEIDSNFGFDVAVHGDTAIVGNTNADVAPFGLGAAYAFVRTGTVWTLQQPLIAANGGSLQFYGWSVDVFGDTAVIGRFESSAEATVFVRRGTTWSQQTQLEPPVPGADHFGVTVRIWEDTIAVAAEFDDEVPLASGAVFVFVRSGSVWSLQQKLVAQDAESSDFLGFSIDLHEDTIVAGAPGEDTNGPDEGAAYVFARSGTTWSQQAKLLENDSDGDDDFGVTCSVFGNTVLVGSHGDDEDGTSSGSVYVFTREGTTWSHELKLTASDADAGDQFGRSLAMSNATALVGANMDDDLGPTTGSAYAIVFGGAIDEFCSAGDQNAASCGACPCGNSPAVGTTGGCINAANASARLLASGSASLSGAGLRFDLTGAFPNAMALLVSAARKLPASGVCAAGSGIPYVEFNGLRCVGGDLRRHGIRPTAADGSVGSATPGWGPPDGPEGGVLAAFAAGQTRNFQAIYRDDETDSCLEVINTSNGVSVAVGP